MTKAKALDTLIKPIIGDNTAMLPSIYDARAMVIGEGRSHTTGEGASQGFLLERGSVGEQSLCLIACNVIYPTLPSASHAR